MPKKFIPVLMCSVLLGCDFLYEPVVRSQIPGGFEIARLTYFNSQMDCTLAVYDIERFDPDSIETGDFVVSNYKSEETLEAQFISITLLAGKTCADNRIRDEFMEFHGKNDNLIMTNTTQNAVIVFNEATRKLYFSGRD